MTKIPSGDKSPPAAQIDPEVLRTIAQNIPDSWQSGVKWSAQRPKIQEESLTFEHDILEDLLSEVSAEERIESVGFEVFEKSEDGIGEIYFRLWCDPSGNVLEYSAPDGKEWQTLSRFAGTVDGILRRHRRLPWFRSAKIRLGMHPDTAWWRLLDWKGITETAIAIVIASVVAGVIMLFIGISIGQGSSS